MFNVFCILPLFGFTQLECLHSHNNIVGIESYYLVLVHFQCHGFPYFLQEDYQQCSRSVFLPHLTTIHNGELERVEGDKATDPTQRMIHHLWLLYIVLPSYLASHWLRAYS